MPDSLNDTRASKADLQALKTKLEALKVSLNGTLATAFKEQHKHIDERFRDQRDYIEERAHEIETRLLRALSDYQQAQTTRFSHMKVDLSNLNR